MKKNLIICVLAAILVVSSATALADGADLDISASYVSKYIWRGMERIDDEDAIQGEIVYTGLAENGITLSAWGSYGLETENLDEVDYTLEYVTALEGGYDLLLGAIYYWFDVADNTWEVYAGLRMAEVALKPTLIVYYDVDEVEGLYANLSGSYCLNIIEDQPIDVGVGIGYFNDYGTIDDGIADIDISAETKIAISDQVYLTPEVHYVLNQEDTVNTDDEFWAGVTLGATF